QDLVLLGNSDELAVLRAEFWLPTWRARCQSRLAVRAELCPPRGQLRAVDAFLAQQCFQRAALAARERSLGGLHQPQLLGRRKLPPRLARHGLLRRAVHARLRLALALGRGGFSTRNLGWLGHARGTIIRQSVQRYQGATVSSDVGTEGPAVL